MADIADQAQIAEEGTREDGLKNHQPTLQSCGFCFYCNESIKPGLLFCGPECRDDWEVWRKSQERNGT